MSIFMRLPLSLATPPGLSLSFLVLPLREGNILQILNAYGFFYLIFALYLVIISIFTL